MGGATLAGQPAPAQTPVRPAAAPVAAIASNSPAKSPVSFFRELLAMTPEQRTLALTNRTEESRKLILAKVREYRSLKTTERELRLRATELEWRLAPLMKMPATNRTTQLAGLPEEDRKMIEDRLEEWDKLPESVKQELLRQRDSIRLFLRMKSGLVTLTNANVQRGPELEAELKKIQAMPEPERQKLIEHFNQYFELKPHEQQKALRKLPPDEQQQIEKSLGKFKNLTAPQRAQCIRSFEQFADMTPAERQQFLDNAARWIMMPPDKRQAWRDVVEQVSETHTPFIKIPRPRTPPNRSAQTVLTTNSN
jgi:uncharacterized membrane-anchored protein YhcB (DUF1043 family)